MRRDEDGLLGGGELGGVQAAVEPAGGQELGVGTLFHDPAVIEDDDAVRATDGCQAVGDDEGGTTTGQIGKCVLDRALGFRIEGGGGFVQDENGRVAKKETGDGEALFLAAGQFHSAFADDGVGTLG